MSKFFKPAAVAVAMVLAPTFALATDNPPKNDTVVGEAATTTKIKAELVKNKTVSAFDIEVDTQGDTVILSGKVRTAAEKAEAERVARATSGVVAVRNNITIDPNS